MSREYTNACPGAYGILAEESATEVHIMTRLLRKALLPGMAMLWQTATALAANELQLTEVAEGIFVSQGVHELMSADNHGAISNSGFIVGEEAVAVIDPGGSLVEGEKLKRAVRKTTDLPIDYLILTHFHPDHIAGAVAFAEAPHVIAHENYARAMTQRAQFYIDRFAELLPGSVMQNFRLPTQSVVTGQAINIDLGLRQISIEAHPLAHTDNDLTVHDKSSNTLWASDLVFAQRTPSLDGSVLGWLRVLEELDERRYGMTVPGHGKPDHWKTITLSQKKYLESLRDDVRRLIQEEASLSDILLAHEKNPDRTSGWILYAMQHASNLTKAYTELEWE